MQKIKHQNHLEHSFVKEIYAYYNQGPLSNSFPKDSPIRTFREIY